MEWQLIYSNSKRQYYFRFRSANNRIIVWSEYYHNRADAIAAIELVQRFATTTPIVEYSVA
jgi:uncharacterized protein YegP (UPF0339 family)